MTQLLNVKAAPGLSVPMEDKPRIHISDSAAVAVPESTYYRRRIADGDLVEEIVASMSVFPTPLNLESNNG